MTSVKEKIKNPLTNRYVLLTSSKGKELIKKYVEKLLSFSKEDEDKIVAHLDSKNPHLKKKIISPSPHKTLSVPHKLAALLKKFIQKSKKFKNMYGSTGLQAFCTKKKPIAENNIDYDISVQLNYDIWEWKSSQILDHSTWPKQNSFDPRQKKFIGKSFSIKYNLINHEFYLRYLQKTPKPSITMEDIIDPVWFRKMNVFLDGLSIRKRCVMFGYTNNSHFHVNPYLYEKNYAMDRFYKWYSTNGHRFNPFFYQLLDTIEKNEDKDILVDQNSTTMMSQIQSCRESSVKISQKYQIIHNLCMKRQFLLPVIENAFKGFIRELQEIILESPPLEKDMVLYRGSKTDYFLKGSKNRTYPNPSFLSCTISSEHAVLYMYSTKCCLHRLLIPKGTNVLFVGGNTVYRNELEFVLPKGCLYTNLETFHTRGGSNSVKLCPTDYKVVQITDTLIYFDKSMMKI